MKVSLRDLPARVSTGGYILHTGWEKWHGDEERAKRIHTTATNAFPFLRTLPPVPFLKTLAAGEMALGVALLTPAVPRRLAGAGLSAFSGALMAMYLRTPTMHRRRSVWPTPVGTAVSKDVWMLGIGLSLMAPD